MERRDPTRNDRGLLVGGAAVAVLLLALGRGDTRAAAEAVTPGFDPASQRAEMVRLLRSIDSRLERLIELRTSSEPEKR